MSANFSFTLSGSVTDVSLLYKTALARAIADGLEPDDAAESLTYDGEPNVSACVRMLLDPGISPDGLEIDDSSCEEF